MRLVRTIVVSGLAAVALAVAATPAGARSVAAAADLQVVVQGANAHNQEGSRDVPTAGVGGSAGGGATGEGSGSLPFTGSQGRDLLVTAVALLAVGAIVVALSRRTRAS
jgi:hypothetical protein